MQTRAGVHERMATVGRAVIRDHLPQQHREFLAMLPTPLLGTLVAGAPIGVAGLQAHSRQRNRLKGHVLERGADGFTVAVQQSFGNCPKYMRSRESHWREQSSMPMFDWPGRFLH